MVWTASSAWPRAARALDKQGAAHQGGGGDATSEGGVSVSGGVFLGVMPYNPSYAARPDNSGLALLRAGGHADVDILGQHLFVPLDLNSFTDRCKNAIRPSEIDGIIGVASAWSLLHGTVEVGARTERDLPADGSANQHTCTPPSSALRAQSYADLRARYVFSAASWFPGLAPALAAGDLTGWVTLGWFAYNPSYAARPDNTGHALLRYAIHFDLSFWHQRLSLGTDATMFTTNGDNEPAGLSARGGPLRPTELDATVEAVFRHDKWDLHLGYERDMPIDRGGLRQQMVMGSVGWSFEVRGIGARRRP
jgi:hypothetical protein